MKRASIISFSIVALAVLALTSGTAHGFGGTSTAWESFYAPDGARVIASLVDAGSSSCQVCHVNANGGQPWNAYGFTLFNNGSDFAAADGMDSDGSGSTNGEEIRFDSSGPYGAQPGWALDPPFAPGNVACFADGTCTSTDPPPTVGPLDPIVAVCGNSVIEAGEDCDDGNTEDGDCCDAQCQFEPADSPCPDGDLCNGDETCDGEGSCLAGSPVVCSDELACNGEETCDPATGCQPGTPVECPVGEICEEPEGLCVIPPECTTDADCDDGVFCNGVETCDTTTGNCVAVSACPPFVDGCVERGAICDEENDTCLDRPNDDLCIDDSLCTVDTCNVTTGLCDNTPVDCSDGIDCTDDICNEGTGECLSTTDDANCDDDGLFCTGDEICDPAVGCVSEGDPCPDGTVCDEVGDTCEAVVACGDGILDPVEECDDGNTEDGDCCSAECLFDPVGSSCEDDLFCNGEETCDGAGGCQAGTEVDCSDGVDCTTDACDEINDECVSTLNDNNCPDDGVFCNGQEICDPVADCVSTGDLCPEGTTCNEETDICVPDTGKVKICHKGKNTITVSAAAVPAHLAHGDTLGECSNNSRRR